MRGTVLVVLASILMTQSPIVASDHSPAHDPPIPPPIPSVPVGCMVSSTPATVCIQYDDGELRLVRVSTGSVAPSHVVVRPPTDPSRLRFSLDVYRASDGRVPRQDLPVEVPLVPAAGPVRVRDWQHLQIGLATADANRDGLPDGVSFSQVLGVSLLGAYGEKLTVSAFDRTGEGIPDTPVYSAGVNGLPPVWLPRPPNTPYPLPPLPRP